MNKILHLITQVTNLISQSSKWANSWCLIFCLGPPTLPNALLPKFQMAASRPFSPVLLSTRHSRRCCWEMTFGDSDPIAVCLEPKDALMRMQKQGTATKTPVSNV